MALARGDAIGVVSPGFAVRGDRLEAGVAALSRMGFRVRLGAHVLDQDGYLAGPDAARARDLQAMLDDPDIRAIWFSRGGWGTARIVDRLSLRAWRRHARILVGHSDATTLFARVQKESAGLCLHGPFVSELGDPSAFHAASLRRSLRGQPVVLPFKRSQIVQPGRARGRLVGGNLTVLAHTLGTRDGFDYRGSVLLLEDVGEETYRLDRLFQHLKRAGVFRQVAAVLLGGFDPPATKRAFPSDRPFDALVSELFGELTVPVIRGLPLGHVAGKWTVPLGGPATVDTAARRVTFDPGPPRARRRR